MLTIPLHCFLNDKNIFHINFTRSLTFQWKLLVMAKHGELFASKILVLCSATYYSAMLITCTQTRIHRTQSLHYDKLSKRSSLRHYCYNELRCNDISWRYIICFARYRCNEVSLERYLGEISRRLYRYLDDLSF